MQRAHPYYKDIRAAIDNAICNLFTQAESASVWLIVKYDYIFIIISLMLSSLVTLQFINLSIYIHPCIYYRSHSYSNLITLKGRHRNRFTVSLYKHWLNCYNLRNRKWYMLSVIHNCQRRISIDIKKVSVLEMIIE